MDTCARCGRTDAAVVLPDRSGRRCPRCFVARRRAIARVNVAFAVLVLLYVAAGGWALVLAGASAVVLAALAVALAQVLAVVLLRGRIEMVCIGRGRLLARAGRLVLRARLGYVGVRYRATRSLSALAQRVVPVLTRLAFAAVAGVVYVAAPRGGIAALVAFVVAVVLVLTAVTLRPQPAYDVTDPADAAVAASGWSTATRAYDRTLLAATYAWAVAAAGAGDSEGAWAAARAAAGHGPVRAEGVVALAAVLARSGYGDDARLLARYATTIATDPAWETRARTLLAAA
jgi:hypothetical protein